MPYKNRLFITSLSLLFIFAAVFCPGKEIEEEFNSKIFVKTLTNLGRHTQGISSIRWNADGTKLLVDKKKNNRYYTVQVLDWKKILDEKTDAAQCVSEFRNGKNVIQNWNNSTPAWTRDGRFIIFSGQSEYGRNLSRSGPFFGMDCSLWITEPAEGKFWKLQPEYPDSRKILGTTAPEFSPDGSRLVWTVTLEPPRPARYYGLRKLALAPVRTTPGTRPKLTAAVKLIDLPGENDFVESYGFSPDGKTLYFSANLTRTDGRRGNWYDMDIYSLDLGTEKALPVPLTQSNTWDRYAETSPRGKKIIWSSGAGFLQPPVGMQGTSWYRYLRSELWIMDADGKNKKQLTRFNDRNAPEFLGRRCYVGMSAWHPDGRKLAVIVNTEGANFNPESHLFILELEAGIRTPGGSLVPLKKLREQENKPRKIYIGK